MRLGRSLIINAQRLRRTEAVSRNETHIWLEGATEPFVLGRAAAAQLQQRGA